MHLHHAVSGVRSATINTQNSHAESVSHLTDFTVLKEGYSSDGLRSGASNHLGGFVKRTLLILIIASALFCSAQQPATDPAMVKFFAGN
jgi:hypothetical protein